MNRRSTALDALSVGAFLAAIAAACIAVASLVAR